MKQRLANLKMRMKKLPVRAYLLYLLIASLIFTGVTFSSYISSTSGGDSTQVALFANGAQIINIPVSKECYPGSSIAVTLDVCNYEGDSICQVSQTYDIRVEFLVGEIPFETSWKNDYNADTFYANDGKVTNRHTLTVSWPAGKNDYKYSDEIEVLRIIVYSEQVN